MPRVLRLFAVGQCRIPARSIEGCIRSSCGWRASASWWSAPDPSPPARVDTLCAEGAVVTVVAPQAVPEISARTDLQWQRREWLPEDLDGVWLCRRARATK